jgi:hypothetical protein
MPTYYETLGSELSVFREERMDAPWRKGLPYCQIEWPEDRRTFMPSPDEDLVHDVLLKILRRGELSYCSILEEEWILKWYGNTYGLREKDGGGTINHDFDPSLKRHFQNSGICWSRGRGIWNPWISTRKILKMKENYSSS